ncbi:hypothetical protein CC86DRAFT_381953 [Ophiobolus disseminans]|uniref:Uncharacterized protein n=1 Tax=Ophiobolus disseminans TaxID=1469910 RepID=A0A6A7A0N7_9PLEO|nr:hypothetical protein CC86DRAFT_381953 [Ophiobolus disseminans]
MIVSLLLPLILCFEHASALAITATATPSPEALPLARRAAMPTFTFGPKERYNPSETLKPEQAVEIFPTGIFDEFPSDGITIAFGPDVHKQIENALARECKKGTYTTECQQALAPILHRTNLSTHTKRFILTASVWITAILVAVVAAWVTQMVNEANEKVPMNIKLNNKDLAQIQTMSDASTFAAIGIGPGAWATATITVHPAATPVSPNVITVETLSVDKDNHHAGDVVYRIPEDTASRIKDFLGMTGIKATQDLCKGRLNIKRADLVEECLKHIQRHAIDLADVGPSNLMQIAQQNIPAAPAAGQAIGFPIENLASQGTVLIIPVYRIIFEHRPRRPNFDLGWDPLVLATGATALTVAAHAVMFAGDSLREIWVNRDKLVTDLKEDKLACPKNIICVADDCLGQYEGSNNVGVFNPYCKKVANFGCKCYPVAYPHVVELEHDYMDEQYKYLEELVMRSTILGYKPDCMPGQFGEQKLDGAMDLWEKLVEDSCKDKSLDSSFSTSGLLQPGWSGGFVFERYKSEPKCEFDCIAMFWRFAEAGGCVGPNSLWQLGEIRTGCGRASYNAYKYQR